MAKHLNSVVAEYDELPSECDEKMLQGQGDDSGADRDLNCSFFLPGDSGHSPNSGHSPKKVSNYSTW